MSECIKICSYLSYCLYKNMSLKLSQLHGKVHIFFLGQIPSKFSINTDKEMQINLTIIL